MKKEFYACLGALAMLTTSCSSELEGPELTPSGDGVVFSVQLPSGIQSRANANRTISDGTSAVDLYVYVYDRDASTTGNEVLIYQEEYTTAKGNPVEDLKKDVTLNLMNDKNYDIVFWAQSPEAPYEYNTATRKVDMNYDLAEKNLANNEDRDAFFYVLNNFNNKRAASTQTIEMKRPFAQINVGTSDLEAANVYHTEAIAKTSMTVKTYNTLVLDRDQENGNAMAKVADEVEATLAIAPFEEIKGNTFPCSAANGYDWIAMNYILIGSDKEVVEVTVKHNEKGQNCNDLVFTNIPIQRNYRTNIYGALLTNPYEYDVIIDEQYDQFDYNSVDMDLMPYPQQADGKWYVEIAAGTRTDKDGKEVSAYTAQDQYNAFAKGMRDGYYAQQPITGTLQVIFKTANGWEHYVDLGDKGPEVKNMYDGKEILPLVATDVNGQTIQHVVIPEQDAIATTVTGAYAENVQFWPAEGTASAAFFTKEETTTEPALSYNNLPIVRPTKLPEAQEPLPQKVGGMVVIISSDDELRGFAEGLNANIYPAEIALAYKDGYAPKVSVNLKKFGGHEYDYNSTANTYTLRTIELGTANGGNQTGYTTYLPENQSQLENAIALYKKDTFKNELKGKDFVITLTPGFKFYSEMEDLPDGCKIVFNLDKTNTESVLYPVLVPKKADDGTFHVEATKQADFGERFYEYIYKGNNNLYDNLGGEFTGIELKKGFEFTSNVPGMNNDYNPRTYALSPSVPMYYYRDGGEKVTVLAPEADNHPYNTVNAYKVSVGRNSTDNLQNVIYCLNDKVYKSNTNISTQGEDATFDFTGKDFEPINYYDGQMTTYNYTRENQEHKNSLNIIGMNINESTTDNVGFFREVGAGFRFDGRAVFKNCEVTGKNNVGLFIGKINSTNADKFVGIVEIRCFEGNKITGQENVGGLIGLATGNGGVTIKASWVSANSGTAPTINGTKNVGAVIGYNETTIDQTKTWTRAPHTYFSGGQHTEDNWNTFTGYGYQTVNGVAITTTTTEYKTSGIAAKAYGRIGAQTGSNSCMNGASSGVTINGVNASYDTNGDLQ